MPLFGRGGIITQSMLDRARTDVMRELDQAGLLTLELTRVKVMRPWIQLNERVGAYIPGSVGTILVPAVTLGRLQEYTGKAPWTGVRDILRHEYGHALADHHPHLVECEAFEKCFGGSHDRLEPAGPYAYHSHVSEYAASEPSEDFAETVMLYLRTGGSMAPYAGRHALRRKLAFVAKLPRQLRA